MELLANLDDINEFLPQDKLTATDGNPAIDRFQIDVDRTIKGYLASVYSLATLQTWADPTSTPAFIRGIAGRLIAAYWYSSRTSEDMPDWNKSYPQRVYDEAMKMLADIRSGDAVLVDVVETPGTVLTEFYKPKADPYFTVGMKF
jgi:hypothetical protein